jgi:hypothetical protein
MVPGSAAAPGDRFEEAFIRLFAGSPFGREARDGQALAACRRRDYADEHEGSNDRQRLRSPAPCRCIGAQRVECSALLGGVLSVYHAHQLARRDSAGSGINDEARLINKRFRNIRRSGR